MYTNLEFLPRGKFICRAGVDLDAPGALVLGLCGRCNWPRVYNIWFSRPYISDISIWVDALSLPVVCYIYTHMYTSLFLFHFVFSPFLQMPGLARILLIRSKVFQLCVVSCIGRKLITSWNFARNWVRAIESIRTKFFDD